MMLRILDDLTLIKGLAKITCRWQALSIDSNSSLLLKVLVKRCRTQWAYLLNLLSKNTFDRNSN